MKKKRKLSKGSPVRDATSGECGIVMEIIGDENDPFGYMVLTATGTKRWILKKRSKVKPSSRP